MKQQLWFDRPSDRYDEGLPLGNGRLGAMVLGNVRERTIYLNEETLWYGGPRDRNNPDALRYLPEVKELMLKDRVSEAERLALMAFTGTPESQRHYTTLGMLVLDFAGHEGKPEKYSRGLDFDTAISTMHYEISNVHFSMSCFVSEPDGVIVVHLEADQPVLEFFAGIERGERVPQFSYGTHMDSVERIGTNGLLMCGCAGGETGVTFRAALLAESDGILEQIGDKLVVKNAKSATLYISASTSFNQNNPEAYSIQQCQAAIKKGYESIKQSHLQSWKNLYGTSSISLDSLPKEQSFCPMNRVFDAFESSNPDIPSLSKQYGLSEDSFWDSIALLQYDFGRYLLAAGSNNCDLPLNLQGIWCRDLLPVWDSKYTTNINLEMAYWPADAAGLGKCFEPYVRLAERIHQNGLVTAKKMYGCRGFVLHNNTDIWADTAVQDAGTHCSYWFTGGAWIAADLFEHYRYTKDIAYLKRIFPILRDAALFLVDFLQEVNGELVMVVSTSPENFYFDQDGKRVSFCKMSAMDSQLAGMAFRQSLEACKILKESGLGEEISEEFEAEVNKTLKKLSKSKIGADGTILEWGIEAKAAEVPHRHQSHVIGAYPYNEITEKDSELFVAVEKSIRQRMAEGGANTGWSRAWAAGLLARLKDGDTALEMVCTMLQYSGQPNLFSCCNIGRIPKLLDNTKPMQVDGNLGIVQAVIEMLLQSHDDVIYLLPALPKRWQSGSFNGLIARGAIKIDAHWEKGRIVWATLTPNVDGQIALHAANLIPDGFDVRMDDGLILIEGKAGNCYRVISG